MKSLIGPVIGLHRASDLAARAVALARLASEYQRLAQREFGRANRMAATMAKSGMKMPNNVILYLPLYRLATMKTRCSARLISTPTTVTAPVSSSPKSNGLTPTSARPRQATARLTISTETRPSSVQ